ncbi:MAG: 3-hydroxyacyl-[acyl-carrier-protein] dehydratase FabZ [Chlamydiales bacterium]|nr:3-hydroxyacyl-[acyl-carrier-protein] dehydratase FabZ [Chlamydiales bacterium]
MEKYAVETPVLFDTKKILEILPHRYPFLLVDKIIEIDLEKPSILGQKNVTMNESFFQGHFPDAPIMPGVLILEALAQTGGVLIHQKGFMDKIALFLTVNQVKFRNPVKPGDVLFLYCEGTVFSSKGGRVKTKAMVGSKVAAEAEMGFALVNKEQI